MDSHIIFTRPANFKVSNFKVSKFQSFKFQSFKFQSFKFQSFTIQDEAVLSSVEFKIISHTSVAKLATLIQEHSI